MTDKQARFVQEYLLDLNATQAAIRAGYSEKSASRIGVELLNKTHVLKALEKAQKSRAAKVSRQSEDVLKDIIDLTREAREAGDFKSAFKGLEMEGRHLGMFKDKVEAEIFGGITIKWQQ